MESSSTNNSSTASNDLPCTQKLLCCEDYGSNDASEGEEVGAGKESDSKTEDSSDKTTTEASENKETSGNTSVRSGSTSPDLHCPICLGQLENRSFTDTCFHKFCFVCLVEWSKVKAVCPLCKQPFTSVIHNVRSYDDFEQLPITGNAPSASSSSATSGHNRFRYRTTMVNGDSLRRQRERESLQRPSRYRHRGASLFDTPPAFTSSYRRSTYRDSLWVQTISGLNRYRDVSSGFFARNPACMHRLVPWLNRELMALLRIPHDVAFMLSVIMDSIQKFDITSDFFYALVSPFLGARTRHFIHEFNSFARSPFDMAAYDVRAVYARIPPTNDAESAVPIECIDASDSGESSAESDNVRIVNSESNSQLTSHQAQVERHSRSQLFSLASSLHTQLAKNDSKSTQSFPLAGTSRDAELGCQVRVVASDDSEDEVVVVAQDKPWRERSPIVLSSSDSDEVGQSSDVQLKDSSKGVTAEQLEEGVASSDDEPVVMSCVKSVAVPVQSHATINNSKRETKHFMTTTSKTSIDASDTIKTPELYAEENKLVSNSKSTDRCAEKDHKKVKHRHRHHHRRHRHSDRTDKSASSRHKPVDGGAGSVSFGIIDGSCTSGSPASPSTTASVDTITQSEDGCVVSDSGAKLNSTIAIRRHAKNELWVSDSSSGDEDNSSSSRAIRSAIVVPRMSQFKKHSSGHKHSEMTPSS